MSRGDRIRRNASERPRGGSILTIGTTHPIGRIALAFACFAAMPACVSGDAWRSPLTISEALQPCPRPDFPGELDIDEIRAQPLDLCNRSVKEKGRGRLKESPRLSEAAQAHAKEMAERRKMTHDGADGSTVAGRAVEFGYKYRLCGENIAKAH